MTQQHSCLNSGRGIAAGSSRFNMASLKINLPQNQHKRTRGGGGGGLSRYYSGKARSFKCLNEVHSIEDLKKKQQQQDYTKIVPPPAVVVAVAVDAHHHDSNNSMNKIKNTFSSSSSSSSFCSIGSFMSKEDINKQHTLFYA